MTMTTGPVLSRKSEPLRWDRFPAGKIGTTGSRSSLLPRGQDAPTSIHKGRTRALRSANPAKGDGEVGRSEPT